MDIIFLLVLLQYKHYYADFCLQTYQQTIRKGIYKDPVGISHSLDHVVCTLIALMFFHVFFPLPVWKILVAAILEGILHYHIDWSKVKFGCKDMTKPLFWNQFGLDQLAHQLTYIIMVWYLLLL